jgi:hypothetical protein
MVLRWLCIILFLVFGEGLRIRSLMCLAPARTARMVHEVQATDPDVWSIIKNEYKRQRRGIELIASENYASDAVMSALGSCMTNKYSEGQPGSR